MTHDSLGNIGDTVSMFTVIGVVSNLLPPIAALLAIIWTAIRIYEYARWKLGYVSEEERLK